MEMLRKRILKMRAILIWFVIIMPLMSMAVVSMPVYASSTVLSTQPEEEGAIAVKVQCLFKLMNFSRNGVKTNIFRAWVKNLNHKEATLVRVVFDVWTDTGGHLGAIESEQRWIGPNSVAMFAVDFYFPDYKWGFKGTFMEFVVFVIVFYMDYEIQPGEPHWTTVPDAPEFAFTFYVVQKAPVPVYTWTDLGGNTVLLDASESYDPDEKWGDYIEQYQWVIFVDLSPQPLYGPTVTYTFDAPGTYTVRLRLADTFDARKSEWFSVTVTT